MDFSSPYRHVNYEHARKYSPSVLECYIFWHGLDEPARGCHLIRDLVRLQDHLGKQGSFEQRSIRSVKRISVQSINLDHEAGTHKKTGKCIFTVLD